ncbi:MAG TPA: Ig-like domain-containing protein, partial [Actinomycetota bacterium]|nr:Ig-like domain-containing protein [Actinomycetota bacterium]
PQNPSGPNPTGAGGASFGDVSGNNPAQTAGDFGRNTSVHGEVGPTDANGQVTFGITMLPASSSGTVTVMVWVETGDGDVFVEGPSDTSTKTWVHNDGLPVTSLDATPESSTNPNGTQHTVTVRVTNGGNPLQGVVPASLVMPDASGRPAGDVADPAAGASPNYLGGKPKPLAYQCTPSNAQGFSTCTFQDPAGTGAGTDTIVFFDDQDGDPARPDGFDPQDAVQKSWFVPAPPTPTPSPPPTATPSPSPSPSPGPATPEARNVRLCHGSAVAPVCGTAVEARGLGDEHELSALVTDRGGAPLANVPVEFRETGPATFVPGGADSVLATTGSDGIARAVLTSEDFGTSTIVAEISPPGTTGSFRGPGSSDDECEQPAGPGGTPAAGNCVSQALTVAWEDVHPTECGDGRDNDDDGYVDLDDPGCVDELDDDETPGPDQSTFRHPRRINMRFRDWVGPGDEGLVIFGRVRLSEDGDTFRKCTQGQRVRIQRLVDGDWVTKKNATTNARGRYTGVVFDRPGRYRAVALRSQIPVDDVVVHVCPRVEIEKTHHHRR